MNFPSSPKNLGVITPEVEAIRLEFGFPGMSILQFAFGVDPQAPDFKPHNFPHDRFAYTGTHDNDTVMGWWNSQGGDSTRTDEQIHQEKGNALDYLGATDDGEMNWKLIRLLSQASRPARWSPCRMCSASAATPASTRPARWVATGDGDSVKNN